MGGSGENNGIWGSPQGGGWFKKSRPLFLLGFENQIYLTDSFFKFK
jgi:hypothetical protein